MKRSMSNSLDKFTATSTEDQKDSSVVFEVPNSELKKNYKFCPSNEKLLTGNINNSLFISINLLA